MSYALFPLAPPVPQVPDDHAGDRLPLPDNKRSRQYCRDEQAADKAQLVRIALYLDQVHPRTKAGERGADDGARGHASGVVVETPNLKVVRAGASTARGATRFAAGVVALALVAYAIAFVLVGAYDLVVLVLVFVLVLLSLLFSLVSPF